MLKSLLLCHPHINLSFFSKQSRPLMINEDYTRGALAVAKGLAKKLGNSQERRHLEVKKSSHFPENIPKLCLGNHKIKFLTD